MKKFLLILLSILVVMVLALILWISQATATSHASEAAELGQSVSEAQMLASLQQSQRVQLTTLVSADWAVPLSGLLDLDSEKAKAAGLTDRLEPIQIYSYHLKHPKFGDFLIDTGVANDFAHAPESVGVPSWMVPELGLEHLTLRQSTEDMLQQIAAPLKGVFLTHLHLDHISGLPAINKDVPIYTGAGEADEHYWMYAVTGGTVTRMLEGRGALKEWQGQIVDVFADGSVYAIHVPGHTQGSTAYLINSTDGPVLLTGDICHTAWGWKNNVTPGNFSSDHQHNQTSLSYLIDLVANNPQIQVKLGHQSL